MSTLRAKAALLVLWGCGAALATQMGPAPQIPAAGPPNAAAPRDCCQESTGLWSAQVSLSAEPAPWWFQFEAGSDRGGEAGDGDKRQSDQWNAEDFQAMFDDAGPMELDRTRFPFVEVKRRKRTRIESAFVRIEKSDDRVPSPWDSSPDDIQDSPTGPEFVLSNEAAALRAQNDALLSRDASAAQSTGK